MQLTRKNRRGLTVALVVVASLFIGTAAGYAKYLHRREVPDTVLRALMKKSKPQPRRIIRRTPTGPRGTVEDFFRDIGDPLGDSIATRTSSTVSTSTLGAPDLESMVRSVPFSMRLTETSPIIGRSRGGSALPGSGGGGSNARGGPRLPWGGGSGSVAGPSQTALGTPSEGAPVSAPEPSAPLLFFTGSAAVAYALRGKRVTVSVALRA